MTRPDIGMSNYMAAMEKAWYAIDPDDGGFLQMTEEEYLFRKAKRRVLDIIQSPSPVSLDELFNLVDTIVDFEIKHNLKPFTF